MDDDDDDNEEYSKGEDGDLVVVQSALDVSRRSSDGIRLSGANRSMNVEDEEASLGTMRLHHRREGRA